MKEHLIADDSVNDYSTDNLALEHTYLEAFHGKVNKVHLDNWNKSLSDGERIKDGAILEEW